MSPRNKSLFAGAALATVALLQSGQALAASKPAKAAPAAAAPDPRDAQIAELRAEVQALAAEVQDLKNTVHSSASDVAEVKSAQTDNAAQLADLKAATSDNFHQVRDAEAALPKVSLANARPTISTADGKFTFALRSVVQLDASHSAVHPETAANDVGSGTNFRRARLGFDGTAYGDWNFALWGEFGGTGGESPVLNQAYVEYAGFKPFGADHPFRLRIGAWAAPSSLEDATSNTESLFLERPAVAEMIRGLDAGDGRTGVGFVQNGERWYVEGVYTGKVVGAATVPNNQQRGFVTRVAFNPIHGLDYDVHLGFSAQGVIEPANTATYPGVTEVLNLQERPELRVDTLRLVSTGNIAARAMQAYGLEAGASWRNFYAAGEWFRIDVDRSAIGTTPVASPFDPQFGGWYLQGAWTLTGEHHAWSSASGGFRGIRPAKSFNLEKRDWGAFEVALRYSVLNLNDHYGVAGAATPTGGIRGGEQDIFTVGLNWYPNSVVRFLLDYQDGRVHRLGATGLNVGESIHAIALRSQFAF